MSAKRVNERKMRAHARRKNTKYAPVDSLLFELFHPSHTRQNCQTQSRQGEVFNDVPNGYRIQYLQFLQSPVRDTARTELMAKEFVRKKIVK